MLFGRLFVTVAACGCSLHKNQAFRTSPTNRGSSLHFVPGLPAAGATILAAKINKNTFFSTKIDFRGKLCATENFFVNQHFSHSSPKLQNPLRLPRHFLPKSYPKSPKIPQLQKKSTFSQFFSKKSQIFGKNRQVCYIFITGTF